MPLFTLRPYAPAKTSAGITEPPSRTGLPIARPGAPTARQRRSPQSGLWGCLTALAVVLPSGLLSSGAVCHAGGGPENVFLLVNSNSQDSLTVANHYVALRKIPVSNVFYLPYKSSKLEVSGAVFRDQILLPAFAEIERRKLANQIDYLVYSCDFPWRVFFASDFPGETFAPQLAPRGSLTGLTYLAAFVKEKRKEVVSMHANWYFMEPLHGITISRAFRSQYRWSMGGRRAGAQGLPYMISSMLGVTDGRGNKLPEIINSLRLAQKADGTKPAGTVYFMKHNGPRSTPRHDLFEPAAAELRRLGVATKILEGKFPDHKMSIAGLTCGTAYANLGTSGCRFLPGAFCDNLTSFGALFSISKPKIDKKTGLKRKEQLSVADFIRHGATAASGTVFEPYSIRQKFPLPSVHVHYASGCSLGESFYQSVSGPYQQLLVGDPLCQPWADLPSVQVETIKNRQVIRGQLEIAPTANVQDEKTIGKFDLYLDGIRMQSCRPGEKLQLDTTTLQDGHHEIRIVATDSTPIETQGRFIANVIVKNGREAIGLTMKQQNLTSETKSLTLNVVSTLNTSVDLFLNSKKLGSLPTGSGALEVGIDKIGAGPVQLYAASESVRSKPLQFDVDP